MNGLKELIQNEIKALTDHRKDAEMHYWYALQAKQAGYPELCKDHITEGLRRLDVIVPAHKGVNSLVKADTTAHSDHQRGVWEGMHECMVDEVQQLRKKFKELEAKA